MREIQNDLSSFCHHCHRVLIPSATDCLDVIRPWFGHEHDLRDQESIHELSDRPYVYYEVGTLTGHHLRKAFTEERGIPSQFMRGVLTRALNTGRHYSWTQDHNYPELVETIGRMRGDFLGLDPLPDDESLQARLALAHNLSIDGHSFVGKTALGSVLGRLSGRPVIDTGLIFRHLAVSDFRGQQPPDVAQLKVLLTTHAVDPDLRKPEVLPHLRRIVADSGWRSLYERLLKELSNELRPCIIIGRDTWRTVIGNGTPLLVEADFDTRVRRRALALAREQALIPNLAEVARQAHVDDEADRPRLPPRDVKNLVTINNGRRPLSAVLADILHQLGLRS